MEILEQTILEAQKGSEKAKDKLIKMMLDNNYMKRINKYLHKNRLLHPTDIESDFWLGVTKAIPVVRYRLSKDNEPDTNDPLQYLAWRGLCHVKTSLRRAIQKGVILRCNECGYESKIKNKDGRCQNCGSLYTESFQFENLIQHYERAINKIHVDNQSINDIHNEDRLAQIRNRLSPRQKQVLELWLKSLSSADTKNYMKEISREMHISPQCVKIYIDRIKQKAKEIENDA